MLLGVGEADDLASEVLDLAPVEVVTLHELLGDGLGFSLHLGDSALEPEGLVRHLVDGLGPVGSEHHADVVLPDVLDQFLVDDLGGVGVEGSGGLVGQEEQGLLGELPGKDDPLFLSSGQVTRDVHGPVAHVYEFEEGDGLLHTVGGLGTDCLQYVLDDSEVSPESEGPLEHDGDPVLDGLPHGVVFLEGPEVHIDALGVPVADLTGRSLVGESEMPAFDAAGDVVDDAPGIGLVLGVSPQHVEEHALTCTALSDESGDLAGADYSAEVVKYDLTVEFLRNVLDRDQFDRL